MTTNEDKRQAYVYSRTLDKLEKVAPEWCESHGARIAWAAKVAEESQNPGQAS